MAPPEIQLRYVLRGVIIRVIRLPTRPTLELPTVSVLIVRESTMVAPLRRITRTRRINEQTLKLRLILHKALQLTKRPLRMPRGLIPWGKPTVDPANNVQTRSQPARWTVQVSVVWEVESRGL